MERSPPAGVLAPRPSSPGCRPGPRWSAVRHRDAGPEVPRGRCVARRPAALPGGAATESAGPGHASSRLAPTSGRLRLRANPPIGRLATNRIPVLVPPNPVIRGTGTMRALPTPIWYTTLCSTPPLFREMSRKPSTSCRALPSRDPGTRRARPTLPAYTMLCRQIVKTATSANGLRGESGVETPGPNRSNRPRPRHSSPPGG